MNLNELMTKLEKLIDKGEANAGTQVTVQTTTSMELLDIHEIRIFKSRSNKANLVAFRIVTGPPMNEVKH